MELTKEYILLIMWLLGAGIIITRKMYIELLFGAVIISLSGFEAFNSGTIGIFNGYSEFIIITFVFVALAISKIFYNLFAK